MSKPILPEGISLSEDRKGLLNVSDVHLSNLIKQEPISSAYDVEQTPFARGKFATVRRCVSRGGGVAFAAKFMRKRRRAQERGDIVHEVAVLQLAAPCPRVVRLHAVYETPHDMALVLEMASGGELQTVLDEQEGMEEAQAVKVMRHILEGLAFLHDNNIAHLDLKPQNLLLTGKFPDCDIKLCDFGISRVIQNGVSIREILGTPDYVAPEILNYEPISLATDIWSVGVLAYVVLTGYSPFGGDTKQETFCNIAQCNYSFPSELFDNISVAAKDFISSTLVTDPRRRLSAEDCLKHPWIAGTFLTIDQCLLSNKDGIDNSDKSLHVQSNGNIELHLNGNNKEQDLEAHNCEVEKTCESTDVLNINNNYVKDDVIISKGNLKCEQDISSIATETKNYNSSEINITELVKIEKSRSFSDGFDKHEAVKEVKDSCSSECEDEEAENEDEDLPVHKRPKNSSPNRRSSFPIASCLSCSQCGAQCSHIHSKSRNTGISRQHRHSSISNSPVEITVDRAIIC